MIKTSSGNSGFVGADSTALSKYKASEDKTTVYKVTGPGSSTASVPTTVIGGQTYLVVNRASSTGTDDNIYTLHYPKKNFISAAGAERIASRAVRITVRNNKKATSFADIIISRRSLFNLD